MPQQWEGPWPPCTDMEKLVAMGFADRTLNTELLEKHHGVLMDVIDDLLERQNQAFGRTGSAF